MPAIPPRPFVEVKPVERPIDATVKIPGSKSITNRALLIAGLAEGKSELTGALHSDDTAYMADSLNKLGIPVETDLEGERFVVQGGGGSFPAKRADLFVGNAGTAMRFLTAALPLGLGLYRIDGVPRMRQRPMAPLLTALRELGAKIQSEEDNGRAPIVVEANGLPGGVCTMDGSLSSQFFSAVLLAAPCARKGVEIIVEGDLVSKPYMTMTAAVMRDFGAEVVVDDVNWKSFSVARGQHYRGRDYAIEPDASNASYFFAAAAVTGGRVRVNGLGARSLQGDLGFVDVLAQMGAEVIIADDYVEVVGPKNGELTGVTIDMNAISDTAQTLVAIAPLANGPTTITGIHHARLKETDRVAAVVNELRKLGQEVEERPDGLTITPRPIRPAAINTYDDHRMAMSFAILGLRADGVRILDPACVAKTFPDFFERLAYLTGSPLEHSPGLLAG